MIEQRNEYGFPIPPKLEAAKKYAASAKERNKPPCACEQCRIKELEPVVIQITNNWRTQYATPL